MPKLKAFRLMKQFFSSNTNLIKQNTSTIERTSSLKAKNGCQDVRNDEGNPDTQDKSRQAKLEDLK